MTMRGATENRNDARFLLFSNAGRAQRWYLAGTLRVDLVSRTPGCLHTSGLSNNYTQGRIARNTELGYDSGLLESVKDARFPLIINKKIPASLSKDGAKVLQNQPILLTKC